MTEKIMNTLRNKFLNQDGSINKTVLVSFITLLIVLINQILAIFNITPVHEDQIVALINTILTILGLLGFVEGSANDQVQVTDSADSTTAHKSDQVSITATPQTRTLNSLASQANSMTDSLKSAVQSNK